MTNPFVSATAAVFLLLVAHSAAIALEENMLTDAHATDRISILVNAENEGGDKGAQAAGTVLADDFTWITRSGIPPNGKQEQSGPEFLETIRMSASRPSFRQLEISSVKTWPLGPEYSLVRAIVVTPDGRFRNSYVFVLKNGKWCVYSQQVTKLL